MKKYFNEMFNKLNLNYYKKLSKPILKNTDLKSVKSKNQLINLIYEYYRNRSNIQYEKISLQNEIDAIKESNTFSKIMGVITILITITIAMWNNVNVYYNQYTIESNNTIRDLENRKNNYYQKILELDSKIKFVQTLNEKNQLQDYKSSLQREIRYIQNAQQAELDNQSNPSIFSPLNIYNVISVLICSVYFLGLIETRTNNKNYNKKQYLNMKLNIINLVIEQEPNKKELKDKILLTGNKKYF